MNDDSALIEQWREHRSAGAFRELVRRHTGMVFATCCRILRNSSDAEEVTQECFLTLSRANLPASTSVGGWLHMVATRRSIDRVRTENRRRSREQRYAAMDAMHSAQQWSTVSEVIDECIDRLPPRTRDAVVAHYLNQQTQQEIADAMAVSQSTVSRMLSDGIDEVREALRSRGFVVPATAITLCLAESADATAPPALLSSLGKVAVGGGAHHSAALTVWGGLALTKKYALGLAVALVLLFGSGLTLFNVRGADSDRPRAANPVALQAASPEPAASTPSQPELSPQSQPPADGTPLRSELVSETVTEQSPKLAIEGTVIWGGSGRRAPGEDVLLSGTSRERTMKTDAAGAFRFVDLEAGHYELSVTSEDVTPTRSPASIEVGDNATENVVIEITGGGAIEGQIRVGEEPLADTFVPVFQLDRRKNHGSLVVRTDADGWYRVDGILEGERQFYATLDLGDDATCWSNMPIARVEPDSATRLDFVFPSGTGTLDGLVLLNGEPAIKRDLVITFYKRNGVDIVGQVFLRTDDQGLYALDGVPYRDVSVGAALMIEPGRPIYPGPEGTIQRRSGKDTVIDFEFMIVRGRLEGVVTVDGEPAANRRILVSGHFTTTDADGFYRIDGIQSGPFELWAELLTKTGKIYTNDRPVIEVAEGETRTANFDFPGGTAVVKGRIAAEPGDPVVGRVALQSTTGDGVSVFYLARTNSDGRYSVQALPAGTFEVIVWLQSGGPIPDLVASVPVKAGETIELDLVVPDVLRP